jgi:ATPase subunit of ABC transporter with duplicated ATPase domains
LLKALQGAQFETRGSLSRGNIATLYIDQRCDVLDDNKSVLDGVCTVSDQHAETVRGTLAQFLFAADEVFKKTADLSGGERLRVALAGGLLQADMLQLLLLDEPTNNLDVANIEFLEQIVREFRGAVVIASHDETFLGRCGMEEELVVHPRPAAII